MKNAFLIFAKHKSGATAIEYALIASLIAIVAIAAFTLTGGNVSNVFNYVGTQLIAGDNSNTNNNSANLNTLDSLLSSPSSNPWASTTNTCAGSCVTAYNALSPQDQSSVNNVFQQLQANEPIYDVTMNAANFIVDNIIEPTFPPPTIIN